MFFTLPGLTIVRSVSARSVRLARICCLDLDTFFVSVE